MRRATRSFKLRLSTSGMDLLIDCHFHLIRATRRLISLGTTLHVAVVYVSGLRAADLGQPLNAIRQSGLAGVEEHHVGAPRALVHIAASVAERLGKASGGRAESLGTVYLFALHMMRQADASVLRAVHERVRSSDLLVIQEIDK